MGKRKDGFTLQCSCPCVFLPLTSSHSHPPVRALSTISPSSCSPYRQFFCFFLLSMLCSLPLLLPQLTILCSSVHPLMAARARSQPPLAPATPPTPLSTRPPHHCFALQCSHPCVFLPLMSSHSHPPVTVLSTVSLLSLPSVFLLLPPERALLIAPLTPSAHSHPLFSPPTDGTHSSLSTASHSHHLTDAPVNVSSPLSFFFFLPPVLTVLCSGGSTQMMSTHPSPLSLFFSSSSCPKRSPLIAHLTPSAWFIHSSLHAVSPTANLSFLSHRMVIPPHTSFPLVPTGPHPCLCPFRSHVVIVILVSSLPPSLPQLCLLSLLDSPPHSHRLHCLWFPFSLLSVVH